MKQGTENGAAPNEAAGNQERIEEARQLAYDHGLPFSSRPSQGAEDDLDPYTYDASMTPEDFELMEAAMHAYAPPKWCIITSTLKRAASARNTSTGSATQCWPPWRLYERRERDAGNVSHLPRVWLQFRPG